MAVKALIFTCLSTSLGVSVLKALSSDRCSVLFLSLQALQNFKRLLALGDRRVHPVQSCSLRIKPMCLSILKSNLLSLSETGHELLNLSCICLGLKDFLGIVMHMFGFTSCTSAKIKDNICILHPSKLCYSQVAKSFMESLIKLILSPLCGLPFIM